MEASCMHSFALKRTRMADKITKYLLGSEWVQITLQKANLISGYVCAQKVYIFGVCAWYLG